MLHICGLQIFTDNWKHQIHSRLQIYEIDRRFGRETDRDENNTGNKCSLTIVTWDRPCIMTPATEEWTGDTFPLQYATLCKEMGFCRRHQLLDRSAHDILPNKVLLKEKQICDPIVSRKLNYCSPPSHPRPLTPPPPCRQNTHTHFLWWRKILFKWLEYFNGVEILHLTCKFTK